MPPTTCSVLSTRRRPRPPHHRHTLPTVLAHAGRHGGEHAPSHCGQPDQDPGCVSSRVPGPVNACRQWTVTNEASRWSRVLKDWLVSVEWMIYGTVNGSRFVVVSNYLFALSIWLSCTNVCPTTDFVNDSDLLWTLTWTHERLPGPIGSSLSCSPSAAYFTVYWVQRNKCHIFLSFNAVYLFIPKHHVILKNRGESGCQV